MKTNIGISMRTVLLLVCILLVVAFAAVATIGGSQPMRVKRVGPMDLAVKHQISEMTVRKLPKGIPGSGRVYAAKPPMLKNFPVKQIKVR